MLKKIVLIGIISFAFLIFLLPTKIEAAMVYVGTRIENTEDAGGSPFCLPEGTVVSVMDGVVVLDSYTTTEQTCIGGTIWSGPVSLTYGSDYGIKLELFLCEGYWHNGYCWYAGGYSQSCTSICSANGGNYSTDCDEWDKNCEASEHFLGGSCDICSPFCAACYSDVGGSNECYSCEYQDIPNGCDWTIPDFIRVCACAVPTGVFNFLFTAFAS